MHRLHYCSVALLVAFLIAPVAWAQVDCEGVDGGTALPGTPCDNGNVNNTGFPDIWLNDCTCHDYCDGWDMNSGYPGDVCDDGDPTTGNDVILPGCICSGFTPDCEGVLNGPALSWTPCDDGDPETTGEVWTDECVCMIVLDCSGVQGGLALPGTPCNDGDPNTFQETWTNDCDCEAGPNTIEGQVFLDVDENGSFDQGDLPILYRTVHISPDGPYISSGSQGVFSINVGPGTYDISAQNGNFDTAGSAPIQIQLNGFEEVSSGNLLPMIATVELVDLSVTMASSIIRPGFTNNVVVTCKNLGVFQTSGQLTLTFDQQQTHISHSPNGQLNGNNVTWDLPIMGLGEIVSRSVTVHTPASVPIGTGMIYGAHVIATDPDEVPANDQMILHETVVGSYDPNDKRVSPTSLTPQEIADGKPVDYTIRFQNTGTYLAETVRIEDQLSEDLNLSTFEFLGSSHPCTWSIENGMLQFLFEEIMLPDSNANEPESHGFVMFRITPNSDLQLGDAVENTAAIYFDFNEPIITDPAVFTVETSTGISDRKHDQLRIWPNPANDMLNVQLHNGAMIGLVEVIDITGRIVQSEGSSASIERMDVSGLPIGNYTLRITSEEGVFHGRFVKR